MAEKHRIFTTRVASVYPLYVNKLTRKGRTQAELDQVIRWLTGYTTASLASHLKKETDFETFFAKAPKMNPNRRLITGVICGIRVEDITEPTMQEHSISRQTGRRTSQRQSDGESPEVLRCTRVDLIRFQHFSSSPH